MTITVEERAIIEDCYRGCPCGGCTRRRELIAKVLGELDAATDRVTALDECNARLLDRALRAERSEAVACKGRYDNAVAADLAEKRALQAEGQLRQRVTTAMENPLTVEAIRGAVLEALAPPVVHWDSERNGMDDPGAPQYLGSVPRLKPLALVEDRTPEQLAADGDAERTPVRSYASEEDWYNDGCPAEAVIRSTP